MFTTFVFNLVNSAIRHETLQGRKYIVAPMAMLTEGVHAGSGGPLLYRANECKKASQAWNMKPIVVYHPEINGKGVTACDPTVLEKQQVGMVMNTRWDGKLRAEAWIEESRAGDVDKRVLEALEDNRMMEVSTGLYTDNVGEPGEWEGEAYTAEATNHQPDHLALLPDKIGACSIADGAGLLQLNETANAGGVDVTRLLVREMDIMRRMVGNAMSYSNIHSALNKALHMKYKKPGQNNIHDAWVVDVYDSFFVYEKEDEKKLYRLNYTTSDAGVEITGEAEEVVRVTEYRTAQGEFVGNEARTNTEKEIGMNKKELVGGLIANAGTQWNEEDRDALMALEAVTLKKMMPVKNDVPQENAGNDKGGGGEATAQGKQDNKGKEEGAQDNAQAAPAVPVTMEQYVAQAPPEFRDVLVNGLAAHNNAKQALIKQILANKNNRFDEAFLGTKGMAELKGMADLAGPPVKENQANDGNNIPMFYGGAATPPNAPVANVGEQEEPLRMPVMNFASGE